MDLLELVSSHLFGLCDTVSGGSSQSICCLLSDSETLSIISAACPQSKMMERAIYLFLDLEQENAHRDKQDLKFVTCLAIIKVTTH